MSKYNNVTHTVDNVIHVAFISTKNPIKTYRGYPVDVLRTVLTNLDKWEKAQESKLSHISASVTGELEYPWFDLNR